MDWLAETVLNAIEENGNMSPEWLSDKREDYGTASRLEVLRWVCSSLDLTNLHHAARAIGVSVNDLQATRRVLQKI